MQVLYRLKAFKVLVNLNENLLEQNHNTKSSTQWISLNLLEMIAS